MNSTKLAVVIPFFKLTFFEKTLESLSGQTDKRFKLYIGDDSSPEDCSILLEKYKGKFDFIYYRFKNNLGGKSLTQQWDRCIGLSNDEEWFMILGDDDYLADNAVEEFYKYLERTNENKINVIKLNSVLVDENNKIKKHKKPEPLIKSSIQHFLDKYQFEGRSSLSEHIFRKKSYDKHRFVDLPYAWHSDDLALLEFSEYGNILFVEKTLCYVRVFSGSITGNHDSNRKEKRLASKIFFERISENLSRFKKEEKKIFFDIVEWQEYNRNIKINIPNKVKEIIKTFGWKGFIRIIKVK